MLFTMETGKPLTAKVFRAECSRLLERAGVSTEGFKGVSVRRGGATSLSRAGVPDRVIKSYGRWRSSAYKLYTEASEDERRRAAAAMQADVTRGVAVDAPYCSRADGSEVRLGRAEEKGEKEAWKKEMKTIAMRAAAGCRPVKKK